MAKKILEVVGTRPNFVKIAALHRAFESKPNLEAKIVHTGQHYDQQMSSIFFDQLELPKPCYYLGVNSGTPIQQKANIMIAFEEVLDQEYPDLVVVVGDVNSTLACALVAVKKGIPVAHIEAGLRSGDHSMPEEINRILTDRISDYLFVTEESAMLNLLREGIVSPNVFLVGNVMIDSLKFFKEKTNAINLVNRFGALAQKYILITLHRPSNVDSEAGLLQAISVIKGAANYQNILFPIHPRTLKNIKKFGLFKQLKAINNLMLLEPQGYLEFLKLMQEASLVITDSGGIQEETTFLQVPCLTFRNTTERPITITHGTNQLLDKLNSEEVNQKIEEILGGKQKKGRIPPLWDGAAATRIVDKIEQLLYRDQLEPSFP